MPPRADGEWRVTRALSLGLAAHATALLVPAPVAALLLVPGLAG
jgi:hypothetical protein